MTLNFYTLGVLYLVYSFLGWVGETVVATFRGRRFANRGMAAGPFCFVYGTTAILMAVGFADMRTKPVVLFVACMLTATVVEWLTAKLLERLHNRKWWDYSDKKFNLNGYVCLQYSVLWGALGALLAAVLLAMFLGQRYPMDWQPQQDAPQDAAIRQSLLDKGFPAQVLDDLTADEVTQLSGAVRVYHQTERLYSNTDYREVTLSRFLRDPPHTLQYDHTLTETDDAGNRTYRYVYRVYDTLEQTMRHVAVELPAEDGAARFVYIHHLTYAAPPSPYTEMLELWPAWQTQGGWSPGGHVSGRVLYERNGTAQAAPFHTLESGSQQVSDLFGTRQTQRITAGWSFPHGVESPRAYVFYDALRGEDSWVIESWANYVCQTAPVYPFRDAAALWHSYGSDAYSLRQTALQVFDG